MRPIRIPDLAPEQLAELEELYRTTRYARLRTRAQMVLLAAEQRLVAAEIAGIVRSSEETVRRWLKRYLAEGVEGLRDVPHPGAPRKVTEECELLVEAVRRRPRSLGLPFSLWTLRRLADHMAEQTGIRVEYETVRLHLKAEGIVLSRPQHTITSPDPGYALKKGGRRDPRRSRTGGSLLLRRRVQPELDAHPQGDVDPEGPAGDDPNARPTQKTLWHRGGRLPYRRDAGPDP
ncbi:MAG TPA: helix-turn-helix domain-containing protein [Rubrobacteraceae bacterium]|nr:helix-turn-helix domain-containing protein [Rubrobacteraceae bacterium]